MPDAHPNVLEMVARLILAAILGAIVGYERETHSRPAGLRTHMLVCMGSTIFTLVSVSFAGRSMDPGRIASQIVSGIGFLGAGTIIRQGSAVRGLTPAASLWTIAAIGMAVGVNWSLAIFAVFSSIVVVIVLSVVNRLEHSLVLRHRYRDLAVIIKKEEHGIGPILDILTSHGVLVRSVSIEDAENGGQATVRMRLRMPTEADMDSLNAALYQIPFLTSLEWD